MSFQLDNSASTVKCPESEDKWKTERRPSISLLDMTDVLSVQPNTCNQLKQHSRELLEVECATDTIAARLQNSDNNLSDKKEDNTTIKQKSENKAKLLYTSLQKFDPLQSRAEPIVKKVPIVELEEKQQSSSKVTPTRLPTPRRPVLQSHLSAEHFHTNSNNLIAVDINTNPLPPPSSTSLTTTTTTTTTTTNSIQLEPTPPSSPGRRIRHTSIARLAKVPTRESLGKANRELAEFDPLISPVREKRISSTIINSSSEATIKNQKDLLPITTTTTTTKKGVQNSFESTNSLMKHKETTTTPPKQCLNSTTRIPLPVSIPQLQQQQQQNRLVSINNNHNEQKNNNYTTNTTSDNNTNNNKEVKDETHPQESSISRFNNNKEDQVLVPIAITTTTTTASKLRKPEVIVPKSIKRLPSQPKREITVNYQRRPSYPTTANDILQDQWDKEREKSRRLSANLISAQGLISLPDDIENENTSSFIPPLISRSSSHELRMEKIHDRLQCLVDVGIPESNDEPQNEPVITDYKRENGCTEVMSAKTALNKYRPYLSPYEKTEIMRYPSIYCVGSHAKKNWASTDQTALNYGYDDEKGDYQIVIKDHLNYRYEIVESLGKGSFGQVVKCRDHKPAPPSTNDEPTPNNLVAIKIIRNKKRFHAQAQTEVKILEKLMAWDPKNKHYNVKMLNSFYFRDHLCIVFECLSLNLYEILQQNSYQGFSMGLVKRFGYQILSSLKLLSEHNVIHCDLKPENILLRQPDRSGIRVIDYGSSCFVNEKVYTYIQSRFYRAPEVILGLEYGLPIDMWSTGCILAELYTGRPLFPGENEPDQLACIMQLLGVPDKQYLDRCSRKKQFFDMYDQPRKSINSKGKKRRPNTMTFTEALKRSTYDNFDRDFGDFISRCLTWEPEERMKPIEALNHPWVQAMKK